MRRGGTFRGIAPYSFYREHTRLSDQISSLQYDQMVEDALRGVMHKALVITAEHGLPGAHHFYITFRTRFPGVVIPEHLLAKHPDEMTILLQHQFWGLEVTEHVLEVTLSFNKVNERLRVPLDSVTGFADPSAKFGLQFEVDSSEERPALLDALTEEDWDDMARDSMPENLEITKIGPEVAFELSDDEAEEQSPDLEPKGDGDNIVTLDAFRKKVPE